METGHQGALSHRGPAALREQLGKAEGLRLVFWAVFSGPGGNEQEIPSRSDGNEDPRGHEPWPAKPTASATKPSPARQHGRVAEETSARLVVSVC